MRDMLLTVHGIYHEESKRVSSALCRTSNVLLSVSLLHILIVAFIADIFIFYDTVVEDKVVIHR
jgi:hypothetical protein